MAGAYPKDLRTCVPTAVEAGETLGTAAKRFADGTLDCLPLGGDGA